MPPRYRTSSGAPVRSTPRLIRGVELVGIVVVSHSGEIASGTARLAGQMAGPDLVIAAAGGTAGGGLGTDADRVRAAIEEADGGDGVAVLADLGSAILTVREVLAERAGLSEVRLLDAPVVEGAVTAAVAASAGLPLDEVAAAGERARDAGKL
jgi:dihydroxyacetone kinase phosphotransfer subunit